MVTRARLSDWMSAHSLQIAAYLVAGGFIYASLLAAVDRKADREEVQRVEASLERHILVREALTQQQVRQLDALTATMDRIDRRVSAMYCAGKPAGCQ